MTAEIVRQFNVSKENFDAASKGLSTIDEGSRNASRETSNTIDKQRELKSEVESTTAIIERQSSVAHDNAIGTAEGMASASDSAIQTSADTDITIDKQRQLSAEARRSSDEIQVQQIGIITQLTAIMGFQQGISSLTRGVVQLGLVNDETAVKLMKFNTAFQMFAGGVQILKAAQGVMTILNLSTLKNAMLNTYNAVISNPGRAALVGVGIGAAAGVGTYYAMNSQNTNVNNNVVIEGTPSEGQQQSAQMVQQVYCSQEQETMHDHSNESRWCRNN